MIDEIRNLFWLGNVKHFCSREVIFHAHTQYTEIGNLGFLRNINSWLGRNVKVFMGNQEYEQRIISVCGC